MADMTKTMVVYAKLEAILEECELSGEEIKFMLDALKVGFT